MNLQTFLSTSIPRAAADLETALLRLPDDKRNWSAGSQARSAIHMVAEVALLNGDTAAMIETRQGMANSALDELSQRIAELTGDWPALQTLLHHNSARVAAVVGALSDEDFAAEIAMPWGAMMMAQMASYPYWNACYHEGQINFIASMLGCLK